MASTPSLRLHASGRAFAYIAQFNDEILALGAALHAGRVERGMPLASTPQSKASIKESAKARAV